MKGDDRADKRRKRLNRAGLAAVILLAPGGFILGATLAARHYRNRRASKPD
ncbi:hypothetical protein [Stakelama marina]|uniref:Uncharacterized protein n=1 Tax=Stakelama marina TaxID=2826939 RepID=A0A8T4IJS4_9SPHN|nr:hypothetical protein [Stakelama marina]MBR0552599.1 hypothetical protein [Stakelama marina]